jgi:hypothetical protein
LTSPEYEPQFGDYEANCRPRRELLTQRSQNLYFSEVWYGRPGIEEKPTYGLKRAAVSVTPGVTLKTTNSRALNSG